VNYLLRAFQKLNERKDCQLTIVGDGNLRLLLEREASKLGIGQVTKFVGRIPNDELPEVYGSADVFVLPSKNEGMSNALLEAIASGLPVIATDTGAAQEIVKGNGIIIEKENVESIFNALRMMMENRKLREAFSIESRIIAQNLTWKKCANRYWHCFQRVANHESA